MGENTTRTNNVNNQIDHIDLRSEHQDILRLAESTQQNTDMLRLILKNKWIIFLIAGTVPFIALILMFLHVDLISQKIDETLTVWRDDIEIRKESLEAIDYNNLIHTLPIDTIIDIKIKCDKPFRIQNKFIFRVDINNHVEHLWSYEMIVYGYNKSTGNRFEVFRENKKDEMLPTGTIRKIPQFPIPNSSTLRFNKIDTFTVVLSSLHKFHKTQKRHLVESGICSRS